MSLFARYYQDPDNNRHNDKNWPLQSITDTTGPAQKAFVKH